MHMCYSTDARNLACIPWYLRWHLPYCSHSNEITILINIQLACACFNWFNIMNDSLALFLHSIHYTEWLFSIANKEQIDYDYLGSKCAHAAPIDFNISLITKYPNNEYVNVSIIFFRSDFFRTVIFSYFFFSLNFILDMIDGIHTNQNKLNAFDKMEKQIPGYFA